MLKKGKLNLIIDGQFGSTGKGLLAGWLAKKHVKDFDFAIASCGPNAGHTFIDGNKKIVVHHLPMAGCAVDGKLIYICAGSVIDPKILISEVSAFTRPGQDVFVSADCAEVLDRHRNNEKSLERIGSTQKGTGAAIVDKIMRKHNMGFSVLTPNRPKRREQSGALAPARLVNSQRMSRDLMNMMDDGRTGIMEISQGVDLSINGGFFPYCTSREISVAQALSDAGIHPHYLGNVFMSMRTYPIRVAGKSGPFYGDSKETQWEHIGQEPELTTVTRKVRRVATFSWLQFESSMERVLPDYVFMNFMNYLDANEETQFKKSLKAHPLVEGLGTEFIYGYGPDFKNVKEEK